MSSELRDRMAYSAHPLFIMVSFLFRNFLSYGWVIDAKIRFKWPDVGIRFDESLGSGIKFMEVNDWFDELHCGVSCPLR